MTDQPEPQQLTDAGLLAWAVVLGYREEQQRDGLSILGLPYPPCPTCRGEVHGVTYWSLVDRLSDGGRLAIRPCAHVHSFTEDDIERLHEHASEMVRVIRAADDSLDPNVHRWTTDDIIREAQVRVGDPEPEDTCRPVDIGGETIRVRGTGELTDEDRTALAALVGAARRKMAAEPPPIRQQLQAVAFNAVLPALEKHGEWLRLTARRTIANDVLTAIEELVDIGDAEAWCKTCRRVWDGPRHQCESDAEQRLARVREHVVTLLAASDNTPGVLGYRTLLGLIDGKAAA
ncbi:hypothetical protein [Streptomyces sp. SAS_275]|uniref:hypothetical protein n=1 Tax=Streptomyces sp. SAS_275 TaxID=3412746 RepID=UPI00403D15B7